MVDLLINNDYLKTMNNYIDKQYEEDMNRQRDFEALESEYKRLYEQQKQQINNLKTEILKINNDAVNSGDDAQMEITGRVIEALENTIVDDWRVE
ncbi:hypothetical protein MACA111363_02775 [Macrococcoides canis]|uniref:Uncharacterized protein n=1 Tax=Macrococcoides canis TaxID=1855823 RepID=A0A1W7ABV6_9STAP|nr:hypothetical protein MCCS_14230 [Macrococcus canis]